MRLQIVISKTRGGNRYLPYVFTEQGVAILSALLNSDIAIKISIKVINVFVPMRKYLSQDLLVSNIIVKC